MTLLVSLLAGWVPGILFFFWLKKQSSEPGYSDSCVEALKRGVISTLPVVIGSLVFNIIVGRFFGDADHVLYEFVYTFIVVVLVEEAAKDLGLRKVLKKCAYDYSWRDVAVFMSVIGLGFGLAEDIVYIFSSNMGQMLVRGLLMMHAGYGFIFGYFAGKALKTGKKIYYAIGFLIPYILHGVYDFGLDEGVAEWNDDIGVMPVFLAILAFITEVLMIVFVIRAGRKEKYTEPLFPRGPADSTVN